MLSTFVINNEIECLTIIYTSLPAGASLSTLAPVGGDARVDRALRHAEKEMFTNENGGREKVRNVIVLITDSPQAQGEIVDAFIIF